MPSTGFRPLDHLFRRLALAVVLCLCALVSAQATTPLSTPSFPADIEHDLGTVPNGQVVTNVFVLTNTTSASWDIAEVRPMCGCLSVPSWPHSIAPGQRGIFTVVIATAHLAGTNITKTTQVLLKSGTTVQLTLRGTVWRVIEFTPKTVAFTGPLDPTNATRTVQVTINAPSIRLTEARSAHPNVRVNLREIESGRRYELVVSLANTALKGNIFTDVVVKTSSTALPEVTLPVWAMASMPK